MGAAASTFEIRAESALPVVRGVERALRGVRTPGGVLLFCTGQLARQMESLGQALLAVTDLPVVIVEGPGVLSERGELDSESAATGVVWSGKRASLDVCKRDGELTTQELSNMLGPRPTRPSASLMFIRSEGFEPEQLWRLRTTHPDPLIFGAGSYGEPGLVCLRAGELLKPAAACLRLLGVAPPIVRTAHCCRLLSEPRPITKASGAMIEEIDGVPALRLLERLGKELRGQSLVFTVLAPHEARDSGREWLVRGIQGVDPDRAALLISQEVQSDMRITFAVREPAASRLELERTCREVSRDMAGAAPRFGLYFNCSGRGRSLYGSPNVDTRALRAQFGDLPIAGVQSAFEIGPFAGAPALQLYTGVIAVFGAPS